MDGPNHQLAAIMFTDIAGYSAIMGRNEELALNILSANRKIHREKIQDYDGYLLKEIGDGNLVQFHSALNAVLCAMKIQEIANQTLEGQLRIGIHLGEVVLQDQDVFGDGVNIASRIQELAQPGGIYISEAVQKAIRSSSNIALAYLEEVNLKNIDYPIKLYAVVDSFLPAPELGRLNSSVELEGDKAKPSRFWLGAILSLVIVVLSISGLWWFTEYYNSEQQSSKEFLETDPRFEDNSIAVFTLDNFSPNTNNEYFAAGVTEAIRINLGQLAHIKVISRNSIEKLEKMALTTPEIAVKHGIKYVLEGSVQQLETNVRINIQLLSALDDEQLWSKSYDRSFDNILQIQSDIAVDVARHLQITTAQHEGPNLPKIKNPVAYKLFLEVKEKVDHPTGSSSELANVLNILDSVLILEPEFTPVYVAQAKAYLNSMYFGRSNINDVRSEVLRLLMKVMDSGYADSDSRAILGTFYLFDKDFEKAENYLKEAVEINPNNATAQHWLGFLYCFKGEWDKGQVAFKKAVEIDPLNFTYKTDQASLGLYYHGNLEQTFRELEAIYDESTNDYTLFVMSQLNCSIGRFDKAIEIMNRRNVPNAETNWLLGYAYAMAGERDKAIASLEYNLNKREKGYVPGYMLCVLYTGLEEYETALDWLEVEYEEGPSYLLFFALALDVKIEPLVNYARFQDLMAEMPFKRIRPAFKIN